MSFIRGFRTFKNSFLVFGNPHETLPLVYEVLLHNTFVRNLRDIKVFERLKYLKHRLLFDNEPSQIEGHI